MAKRKKIIQIPQGKAEMLASDMGCSRTSVYNALAYRSESENAKEIRRKAVSLYGGILTTKVIF
jgi:hypothetical protein